MEKSPVTADEWVTRINEKEMPALARTVKAIERIRENEESPISALADIILQDAAMTAHVLRLTDSAYHIPRKNRQNTISRALVMLGLDEIKSLCLAVAVLDPLMKGEAQQQLMDEMASSFHSAVQARYLAVLAGERASEEVFIAALLQNLGDLTFWCFGGEKAEQLRKEVARGNEPKEEVQRRVLGFELSEITGKLAEKWGLGKLLIDSVTGEDQTARGRAVKLGCKLAQASKTGWDSPETQKLLEEISHFTRYAPDTLESALRSNTSEAAKVAESYGAHLASDQISEIAKRNSGQKQAELETPIKGKKQFFEADALLQLKIIREISTMVESGATVSDLVAKVLEGIFEGMGMDLALFALVSPNRRYIRLKAVLGNSRNDLQERFKFEIDPKEPSIFKKVIEDGKALWVVERTSEEMRELISEQVAEVIGKSQFFLAPTIVDGQCVGLFYADRQESGRPLDGELFEAFRQLTMQANMALEYIGKY